MAFLPLDQFHMFRVHSTFSIGLASIMALVIGLFFGMEGVSAQQETARTPQYIRSDDAPVISMKIKFIDFDLNENPNEYRETEWTTHPSGGFTTVLNAKRIEGFNDGVFHDQDYYSLSATMIGPDGEELDTPAQIAAAYPDEYYYIADQRYYFYMRNPQGNWVLIKDRNFDGTTGTSGLTRFGFVGADYIDEDANELLSGGVEVNTEGSRDDYMQCKYENLGDGSEEVLCNMQDSVPSNSSRSRLFRADFGDFRLVDSQVTGAANFITEMAICWVGAGSTHNFPSGASLTTNLGNVRTDYTDLPSATGVIYDAVSTSTLCAYFWYSPNPNQTSPLFNGTLPLINQPGDIQVVSGEFEYNPNDDNQGSISPKEYVFFRTPAPGGHRFKWGYDLYLEEFDEQCQDYVIWTTYELIDPATGERSASFDRFDYLETVDLRYYGEDFYNTFDIGDRADEPDAWVDDNDKDICNRDFGATKKNNLTNSSAVRDYPNAFTIDAPLEYTRGEAYLRVYFFVGQEPSFLGLFDATNAYSISERNFYAGHPEFRSRSGGQIDLDIVYDEIIGTFDTTTPAATPTLEDGDIIVPGAEAGGGILGAITGVLIPTNRTTTQIEAFGSTLANNFPISVAGELISFYAAAQSGINNGDAEFSIAYENFFTDDPDDEIRYSITDTVAAIERKDDGDASNDNNLVTSLVRNALLVVLCLTFCFAFLKQGKRVMDKFLDTRKA